MPKFKQMFRGCVTGALLALSALLFAQGTAASIPNGSSVYTFSGWEGPALQVHTYRPSNATPKTPIMIVMHGMGRDADRYRDDWMAVADTVGLIIAAPEFDAERFPKSANYNLGGLVKDSRGPSAFSAIEPLFDDVRSHTGSTQKKYYIYGHSAGSQFVHRFVFATPKARIEKAFAANAGWYTMLSKGIAFPYGLKDSGLHRNTAKDALSAPMVVLLGDADTERSSNLRVTPEADAQGFNRLQRGVLFFSHAATLARKDKLPFAWRMSIVPGAGHQNRKMAWGVVPYIPSTNDKVSSQPAPPE